MTASGSITAESLVERLKDAIRTNGDFPVSARIVNEISSLTKNPNVSADQLSGVILKDPTLGMRLLSVVNSSFYMRARPIMTVSQAIVHIGLNQLADLCANLILLQSFVPTARQGGVFANSLRKAILTSVLTELLSLGLAKREGDIKSVPRSETGYLIGFFAEMGTLLLAFYYPQIYTNAVKRAESRNMEINRSIQQLIGITPLQIAVEITRALELPVFYTKVLSVVSEIRNDPSVLVSLTPDLRYSSLAAFIADALSGLLVPERRKRDLDRVIIEVTSHVGLQPSIVPPILSSLQQSFEEYCNTLELQFPPLPGFLEHYDELSLDDGSHELSNEEESIANAIQDLKALVENGESPQSIITAVIECIAWVLGFDRVILFLLSNNNQMLIGHMGLGDLHDLDVQAMQRPATSSGNTHAVEIIALREGRPVFQGDPILPNGWPLLALPIGLNGKAIGLIYADKFNTTEEELSMQQAAAITLLADLLDQAVTLQERGEG
jgi:HD-like signal output (HDOD) protein